MSFRNSKARTLIATVLMIAVSAVFLYAQQKAGRTSRPLMANTVSRCGQAIERAARPAILPRLRKTAAAVRQWRAEQAGFGSGSEKRAVRRDGQY